MTGLIKRESLADFGIRNITTYATEVNLDRAVPELYDGLKPVLRRVLWSAYHYKSGEAVKSAKIVGHCIGSYSPHGDCLDADTEFYCLDGSIKTIKQLTDENKPTYVLSYNESKDCLVPALAHSWRIGQVTTKKYHITLSDGNTITCTSNHPFYVRSVGWVKAEALEVGMPLLSGGIQLNKRYRTIRLGNHHEKQIFHITCKGKPKDNEARHHINGNTHDDRPDNLVIISRYNHAKVHGNYLTGLDNGRKTMFTDGTEYRSAIRCKNSILMTNYNKVAPLLKATRVYTYLRTKGIPVNANNYEQYRTLYRGAPRYSTLLNKYGVSFVNLKYYAKHGIHIDNSNAIGLTKHLRKAKHNISSKNTVTWVRNKQIRRFMSVALSAYRANKYLDWDLWNSYRKQYHKIKGGGLHNFSGRDVPTKSNIQHVLNRKSCTSAFKVAGKLGFGLSIVSITVETCKPTPMYDFTVDKYHNALVTLPGSYKGIKSFVVAHNSSTYGAMQTLVHHNVPLLEGIGNWGGLLDPAAAYRYTNSRLSRVGWEVFNPNYTPVMDMVPNYDDTDKEPVVLPVRLPFLVLNGAEGIGVGITCSIPTFTIESTLTVLERIFKGEKLSGLDLAKTLKAKQHWGGHLVNTKENRQQWIQLMNTGRAKVQFESTLVIDEAKKTVTISEWPGVNPEKLIQKVRLMPECQRAYNSKGSTTFTIECKKAYNLVQFKDFVAKIQKLATSTANYRFNCTHRTAKTEDGITSYHTEFLALSVKEFFYRWARLRLQLEKKSLEYQINKQQQLIDYSELLIYASTKLDIIFKALRQSDSRSYLVKYLKITQEQADAILDLKVRKLSKLDQQELKLQLKQQQSYMDKLKNYYKKPKAKIISEFEQLKQLVQADLAQKSKRLDQKLVVK